LAELTHERTWLAPTVAVMVVVIVGLTAYELGSSTAATTSSGAGSSTLSSSTLASSTRSDINGSTSTCAQQSLIDYEADASIPMSQQEAIGIAQSSSQYKAITAGAATVNFTGMPQGWTTDHGSCTPSLQFLAVNFDMLAVNGSRYDIIIRVDPYSGTVIGALSQPFVG
jgi:hypothetical protein